MKHQKSSPRDLFLALITLIRPLNSFMMGLATIVSIQISNSIWFYTEFSSNIGYVNGFFIGILAFLTAFLASSFSMALNDYIDYEIDLINSPSRPIPSGKITRRKTLFYAIFLASASFLISLTISYISSLIVLIGLFVSILYNFFFKRRGLIGNIMVAFATSLPFIYGASIFLFSNPVPIFILIMLALLSNISREIIKGIADLPGDRASGVMTLANVYGKNYAANLAFIIILIAVATSLIPFLFSLLKSLYLIPILITDSIFIYSTYRLLKNKTEKIAIKTKNLYLIAMLITLVGFFIISYNG